MGYPRTAANVDERVYHSKPLIQMCLTDVSEQRRTSRWRREWDSNIQDNPLILRTKHLPICWSSPRTSTLSVHIDSLSRTCVLSCLTAIFNIAEIGLDSGTLPTSDQVGLAWKCAEQLDWRRRSCNARSKPPAISRPINVCYWGVKRTRR